MYRMPPEDRARTIRNMHKNFVKFGRHGLRATCERTYEQTEKRRAFRGSGEVITGNGNYVTT